MLEHPGISSRRGSLYLELKTARETGGVRTISREVCPLFYSTLVFFDGVKKQTLFGERAKRKGYNPSTTLR